MTVGVLNGLDEVARLISRESVGLTNNDGEGPEAGGRVSLPQIL